MISDLDLTIGTIVRRKSNRRSAIGGLHQTAASIVMSSGTSRFRMNHEHCGDHVG
jgi:hypothetical protein